MKLSFGGKRLKTIDIAVMYLCCRREVDFDDGEVGGDECIH